MSERVRVRTLDSPVVASVRPPGSKSITIRALAVAALAEGRSHIYGPLEADDTAAMIEALRSLGIDIDSTGEPWSVDGRGGHFHSGSGLIDARESGLTARISIVLAAFAETSTTITGRGRLLKRPVDALVDVLTAQGVSLKTTDGLLPVTVNGQGGLWGGALEIDCSKSTQFATAVLLVSPLMTEPARIRLNGLEGSAGYLDITVSVMEAFGASLSRNITGFDVDSSEYRATDYPVEPDASAAVYPMVSAAITGGRVAIEGLGLGSQQPDIAIVGHLEDMGCRVVEGDNGLMIEGPKSLRPLEADLSAVPDGALALAVACAFANGDSRLSGLASLRYKESDRLASMSDELAKLGVIATAERDSLLIRPGPMKGAVIDPHGDHRVAMSLAVAGLRVEGVEVAHPEVVNKTWPGFWAMLEGLRG